MAQHDSGPYIFISYSHRDRERIDSIAQAMESRGYSVWYDRDIQSGGTWTEALADRIADCTVFMPFISADFCQSDICLKEASFAESEKRAIVPVLLDRTEMPPELRFLLVKLQRYRMESDTTPDVLVNWLDSQNVLRPCQTAPAAHGKARVRCVTLERPSRPSGAFVGRVQKMRDIEAALPAGPVALCGMGGIGKSEICRKLFDKYTAGAGTDLAHHVGWVMWRENLKDTVYSQFSAIEEPNAEAYLGKVRAYLDEQGPDLLLFVDNADDITAEQAADLSKLPCRLLLTSRQNAVNGFISIDTENLPPDECRELYRLTYAEEAKTDGVTLDNAALDDALSDDILYEILRLSAYHTLTVELLSKTQWVAELTVEELRDKLKDFKFDLSDVMEKISYLRKRGEVNGVEEYLPFLEHLCRVFELSKLGETGDEGKAGPLYALRGMSLLAPNTPTPVKDVMKWLDIPSRDGLNRAVRAGWLKKGIEDGKQNVSIHPVIAAVVRKAYPPEAEMVDALAGRLCLDMKVGDAEFFTTKLPVLKHALALDHAAKPLNLYTAKYGLMLGQMGSILVKQGKYEKALFYSLQSTEIVEKVLGPEHREVATAYNNVGVIYNEQGNYPHALEYHQKALRVRKILGLKHPDTADSYNNIGQTYWELGDYSRAIAYHQKALLIDENVQGTEHPSTAIVYNNIGNDYFYQGNYSCALEYHQRALNIRKKALGPEHPDTANSFLNVGVLYFHQRNFKEALKWLEKAQTAYLKVLGPNHPHTINSQEWLDFTHRALSEEGGTPP